MGAFVLGGGNDIIAERLETVPRLRNRCMDVVDSSKLAVVGRLAVVDRVHVSVGKHRRALVSLPSQPR